MFKMKFFSHSSAVIHTSYFTAFNNTEQGIRHIIKTTIHSWAMDELSLTIYIELQWLTGPRVTFGPNLLIMYLPKIMNYYLTIWLSQ